MSRHQSCNFTYQFQAAHQCSKVSLGLVKRVPSRRNIFLLQCGGVLDCTLGCTFVSALAALVPFLSALGPGSFYGRWCLGGFLCSRFSGLESLWPPSSCIFVWVLAALGLPCFGSSALPRSVVPWGLCLALGCFCSLGLPPVAHKLLSAQSDKNLDLMNALQAFGL